jgi:hypothetical protein
LCATFPFGGHVHHSCFIPAKETTMRTMTGPAAGVKNRRATRDQLTKRVNGDLPDGVGGTITGGPMEPINVMEILARGARGVAGAGAVSGAAQVVVGSVGSSRGRDHGIALSDGSRISFASIADAGVLKDDDVRDSAYDGARVRAYDDTRVLTSV